MDSADPMPLLGTEEQNSESTETHTKPAAHFFMACRLYNGCIQNDKKEYHWEKGIQSISPLSGARVSTEAVVEVHPNKVPIRINGPHGPAPANNEERELLDTDLSEPPLVFDAGIPHVIVDPTYDMFCLSSFGSDWEPDATFSGGNAFRHKSPLAGVRRVGLGLPPLTRTGYVVECEDCKETIEESPCLAWRGNPPHYCNFCVGDWVAYFRNLEQVFLIVPGLVRAEPGGAVNVHRYGNKKHVEEIIKAKDTAVRDDHFPTVFEFDLVDGEFIDHDFIGVETMEFLGSDGPACFEGNGIKLWEASTFQRRSEGRSRFSHKLFLETLFWGFCAARTELEIEGGGVFDHEWGLEGFPAHPPPETAKIAGGVVEFRVLTYELQDGSE